MSRPFRALKSFVPVRSVHSNIVTLHRTLETSASPLVLLEYVPGQDLFSFLEQVRDHYDVDLAADPALTHTPPTPGLLSSLHPFSCSRTPVSASSPRCAPKWASAVVTCHDASVFHHDIKPENLLSPTTGLSITEASDDNANLDVISPSDAC
jgi:serine/threonine protein kinase